MTYAWFRIFNEAEFLATGLVSKAYIVILEGIGEKKIMALRGENTSILYEGVLLSVFLNGKNPFEFDGYAVGKDENGDILLGIPVVE